MNLGIRTNNCARRGANEKERQIEGNGKKFEMVQKKWKKKRREKAKGRDISRGDLYLRLLLTGMAVTDDGNTRFWLLARAKKKEK